MTSSTGTTSDLIDRLGQAALECRAAIREAHEATADLRAVVKEARTLAAEIRDAANEEVHEHLAAVVAGATDYFRDVCTAETQAAATVVLDSFDNLARPLVRTLAELEQRASWMGAVLSSGPDIPADPTPGMREMLAHPDRWAKRAVTAKADQ